MEDKKERNLVTVDIKAIKYNKIYQELLLMENAPALLRRLLVQEIQRIESLRK